MKYASKYYPFSFVRASSPHPRTHTDARRSWLMAVPLPPTRGAAGARRGVPLGQPSAPRPRVTPGHLYGLARAVGRPRETARVGHADTRPRSPRAKGHRTDGLGHRARAGGRPHLPRTAPHATYYIATINNIHSMLPKTILLFLTGNFVLIWIWTRCEF